MWNKIGEVLEENKNKIMGFIKNTISWVQTNLPRAIHIAIGALSQLWDSFSETFNNIKELVLDVTEGAGSAFMDFLRYDETTGSGIERALTSIVIGLVRIGQEIRNVFEDMKVGMLNIGAKAQGGFVKWIGEVGEQLVPDWAGGEWFTKAKLAGSVLGGGVTMDKEGRAARDAAEVDSLLAAMNARFEERETMKEAEEAGKEIGEAAVAKIKEWVAPQEEAWRTALYQGSDKRAKQSELAKLRNSLKEVRGLLKITDGEIELSDKGMKTIERKVSRQGFPVDRKKEEAKRLDEVMGKFGSLTGRRLVLEEELGITSAKKNLREMQGLGKPEEEKGGEGRTIAPPKLAMAGFSTTIQTAIGSAKVGATSELVTIGRKIAKAIDDAKALAQDTADNTLATATNTSEEKLK